MLALISIQKTMISCFPIKRFNQMLVIELTLSILSCLDLAFKKLFHNHISYFQVQFFWFIYNNLTMSLGEIYDQEYDFSKHSKNQKKTPQTLKQMQAFNEIFKQIKKKMRVIRFISNISKNNIFSKPVEYKINESVSHAFDWQGWRINTSLENVVLILDIIFTLANFVLSTFEAFLGGYQQFKQDHPYIIIVNIIAVVIYLLKTIMSLGTQDVEHGVHYIYLTDIIKKELLKSRFYVQISLAVIIIISMASASIDDQNTEIVGVIYFVLCILKIFNLTFSLFKLEIMLVNTVKKARYWNLAKMFVFNLLFAHFTASVFLAMLKMNRHTNWYETKNNAPENPSWIELYVWSFYWACSTMITVGYGDITPAVAEEAMIVAALEILSSIVVAYNISLIGSIIMSINETNKVLNTKIGLLRRMNSENAVSMELNLVMEEYLIHEATISEEFEFSKHRELISSMPEQLQNQYYAQAQKNIFRKMPFFMNLSQETLIKFFLQCQDKVYYPGEFIIRKSFTQEIIIVLKGQLGYCYQKIESTFNGTVIQKISIDYSCDRPFLLAKNVFNKNQGTFFDIKATKYSSVLKLSTEVFLSILRENQIDYHYYLMTLHCHQSESTLAFNKCEYCTFDFHTKFQCPKLHFCPIKSLIFSRHNQYQHSNNNQLRQKLMIQRKEVRIRPYLLKYNINGNTGQQSRNHFNGKIQKNYLKLILMAYGEKKINHNVTTYAALSKYKDAKLVQMNNNSIQETGVCIDEAYDFHHYFTQNNPSKLLNVYIGNKNKLVKTVIGSILCI